MSTKHEIAEKPAAPEKTPAKAAAATAGSRGELRLDSAASAATARLPHPTAGAPKREYPTLGYE